jgi:hypothetical protein
MLCDIYLYTLCYYMCCLLGACMRCTWLCSLKPGVTTIDRAVPIWGNRVVGSPSIHLRKPCLEITADLGSNRGLCGPAVGGDGGRRLRPCPRHPRWLRCVAVKLEKTRTPSSGEFGLSAQRISRRRQCFTEGDERHRRRHIRYDHLVRILPRSPGL